MAASPQKTFSLEFSTMAYSLKRDPREPDYRRRLPTALELEQQKPVKVGKEPVPDRLGPRSRQMVLLLTVVGLATFMVPLFQAAPAVMGQAQWSPFQLFMGLTGKTLPTAVLLTAQGLRDVRWLVVMDTLLFGALFEYGVLASVLISVLGNASRMVVGCAGALGVLAALIEMRGYDDIQLAIYGGLPATVGGQHVRGMTWSLLMLAVMGLTLVVSVYKELDGEAPARL
ncbi:MAG TPA: hypothetical protein VHX60_03795 [Acidobacteriaceae bacterium]|jgi:hypothetical protein|nr:hypothetical protein [Acidobacteriaceae bacterium]